jgi:uncharacterized protein (DUF983 family)
VIFITNKKTKKRTFDKNLKSMLAKLKGTRLYSILNNKCPRCHEGDFYITKHPYQIHNFGKNHEHCSACGYKFEKEPGYFYGAMYVSYALTVAFSVAIAVAIIVLFPSSGYKVYMISILLGLVVLMPLSFRLSRLIWMNLFQHYDKEALERKK